jgi:hypothetical protein
MRPRGGRTLTIVFPALLLVLLFPIGAAAADSSGATGQIVVISTGPRPMPPTATALQFTGLASDNVTVLFGPETDAASPEILLDRVPSAVKILRIDYLAGTTTVGLFEGFVTVTPGKITSVVSPPWVTVPPCSTPTPDELGQFGARLDEIGRSRAALALPPSAVTGTHVAGLGNSAPPAFLTLPPRARLDNLPPPGMQGTIQHLGSPGSCISWSFAYGLGSYTAARNPDGSIRWDTADPANQVSAAFLYTLVHAEEGKTCPEDSSDGYTPALVRTGAPSAAQVPYAPDCCYLSTTGINIDQQFPNEEKFRLGSYARIPLPASDSSVDPVVTLALLKEFLAAGMAVAFAGPVFENFASLPLDHGVFYPTGWCPAGTGCGHGMLLVGYDDEIGDPVKGRGAFLVQNSFGTHWPPTADASPAPPGRFYLSYRGFLNSQLSAQVAYPLDRVVPLVPPLASSVNDAPAAYITTGYQWQNFSPQSFLGPGLPPLTYLILQHQFSEPVELSSVTLVEPPPFGARVTQLNGYPISNGYTYLVRQDGQSFVSGTYGVTIEAVTGGGLTVSYTGTVYVSSLRLIQAGASMPAFVGTTTGARVLVQQ